MTRVEALAALDSETLEAILSWSQVSEGEVGLDSWEIALQGEVRDALKARVEPHPFKPPTPTYYVCSVLHCNGRRDDPIHVK